MFYYFGYGSNLSVISLRAKGVTPLSSEPAILEGWRVVFNIPDFFRIEGGTGNIEPCEDDAVHGVLHGCRDRDLATLDRLEALGITYERIEATVVTYGGRRVRAYVYVGIASTLDTNALPSERYRNILVRGAEDMNLDPTYVARLRMVPTCERPNRGPWVPPPGGDVFTLDDLGRHPMHTALAGSVFDMSGARAEHAYLQRLLAGRDVTLLFLKRMDSSDGTESVADVVEGKLTDAQRVYLNDYLHEFAHEYRYAGRLVYTGHTDETLTTTVGVESVRTSQRPRASWRPPSVFALSESAEQIAVRSVLLRAEQTSYELGHENLGFLSESHGFMPRDEPSRQLPPAFTAWDQAAAELPQLYASLRLRRTLDALPLLDASEASLPDRDLLRAAAVLAILSHAYWYVESSPPTRLPDALEIPWRTVRERLGRGPAVLSYIDLIVYNWRLLDPDRPDPMRIENLRLLLPTVDNAEERVFYLTQTEILAHCSPVIGACVRAQESVVRDDPEALESALLTIIGCLQRVVHESLLNINPNPSSRTYVDPVVWAKTVAPFAVPFEQNVQGPSGTSSPIFNTLDVFFGRKKYETFLGREIKQLRDVYPPFWREFLAALGEISVEEYVRKKGSRELVGLLQDAFEMYAGDNGFLGRHRMKVFGYLEIAFKVGRSVTIGGFKGMFQDRTWEQVDGELESSRGERIVTFPRTSHRARVKSVGPDAPDAPDGLHHVLLDVSEAGLRYEAGDRCGILPETSDDLVHKTLAALGATGGERVDLTAEWQSAVSLRPGYEHATTLPLADLLRFGRIRPVTPRLAEALHAITQSRALEDALRTQTTEQWEMWDLLALLAKDGFDPRSLWDGSKGRDVLCRVVPPETFRMYSISSVMSSAQVVPPDEIELTVGRIAYESETAEGGRAPRVGTASRFLADAAGREQPIAIVVQHPPRFTLPKDPKTPIVMLAGGTGISPFRGFLIERLRQINAGPAWLFVSFRSPAYLRTYEAELAPLLATGKLELRVAFTREDASVRFDPSAGGRFVYETGRRKRVQDLLSEDDAADTLWRLLRPVEQGGRGAYLYLCGRSGFARTVDDTLVDVFARYQEGEDAVESARGHLNRLTGEGRYMQEIFTDARSADAARTSLRVSDIVLRNDDEHGYWLLIDDIVYDVTRFVQQHPGGARILQTYAGFDGTDGYRRVHAGRTEVDAMREMYEVGVLHKPDFKRVRAEIQRDGEAQSIALAAMYRQWVKALYLAVEMQNALRADQHLQATITTRDDPADPRSIYKLQKSIETHERFQKSYLDGLFDGPLPELWATAHGVFVRDAEERDFMETRIEELRNGRDATWAAALVPTLHVAVHDAAARALDADDRDRLRLLRACRALEEEDARLLRELKMTLRDGVLGFEEHAHEALERGAERILGACKQLPDVVEVYFRRIVRRLRDEAGWRVSLRGAPTPDDGQERKRAMFENVLITSYWSMAEDAERKVVMVRRSPVPVETLEELVRQNDKLLAQIRPEHETWGVIVDMRQAPARNDPAFENAMRRFRDGFGSTFARRAVLLESAVGVLQVNRIGRAEEPSWYATQSETAALQFAMGKSTR